MDKGSYLQHYRIEKPLGSGGMGTVYLATDTKLERLVAIKTLNEEKQSSHYQERLRQESKILAQLNHPNIVQIYDFIEHENKVMLVMEYIDGETLEQWCKRDIRDTTRVLPLVIEIAKGLQAAHQHGIIHRDLKLDNIIITPSGNIKIADFGIAKAISSDNSLKTQDGLVLGSYCSMSPEQIYGQKLDGKNDLFSLGLITFYLLCGHHAFSDAKDSESYIQGVLNNSPRLHLLDKEIPQELISLIYNLLKKQPDLRPESALAVEKELLNISQRQESKIPNANTTIYTNKLIFEKKHGFIEKINENLFNRKTGIITLSLCLVVFGLFKLLDLGVKPKQLSYIATFPPENLGAFEEDNALLSRTVHQAIMTGIMSLEDTALINIDELNSYSGTSLHKARASGANKLVTSTLRCSDSLCELEIILTRIKDSSVIRHVSSTVKIDEYTSLHHSIVGKTQNLLNNFKIRKNVVNLRISEKGYFRYLSAIADTRENTKDNLFIDELLDIQSQWPEYIPIYYTLTSHYLDRYWDSHDGEYLKKAHILLENALRRLPDNPDILYNLALVLLKEKKYEQIPILVSHLRRSELNEPLITRLEAEYWQKTGNYEQALAVLNQSLALRKSTKTLYRKALILWILGKTDASEAILQDILNKNTDYLPAMGLIADIALIKGDAKNAIDRYKALLKHQNTSLNNGNLGLAYLLNQNFLQAEKQFLIAHSAEPERTTWLLNLADSQLLQAKQTEATANYKSVIKSLSKKTAESHEYYSLKSQALARLGQFENAVIALKKGMALGADSLEILYAASIVYSLSGDDVSAGLHTKLALEKGLSPGWLELPWPSDNNIIGNISSEKR
ncbi:serine/threonine-protein kinase [Agarilytica rhodophyticola]|uniref:serine/threonine-protein kinase n=1 Tax=Agarilytica rhodophyticola TaxID=1737490 RepID=UPI000B348999|nr:serine/threonine-protein kinase [Agarilytica rhodophyticola]